MFDFSFMFSLPPVWEERISIIKNQTVEVSGSQHPWGSFFIKDVANFMTEIPKGE